MASNFQNWAEEDSSDDENDQLKTAQNVLQDNNESCQADGAGDEESDTSTEDEDDEIANSNSIAIVNSNSLKPFLKKKIAVPLSKRDLKEIKKKELEDLDTVLAELGIENNQIDQVDETLTEQASVMIQNEEIKKKKSKKNKKSNSSPADSTATEAAATASTISHENFSAEQTNVVVDINSVLKNRIKSKKSTGVVDAKKIAVAEALKESRSVKDKKSKDKQKGYSEFSY